MAVPSNNEKVARALPRKRDDLVAFIVRHVLAIAHGVGAECKVGWSPRPVVMASRGVMHLALETPPEKAGDPYVIELRHLGHKVFSATCVGTEKVECVKVTLRRGEWVRELVDWAERVKQVRHR
jgi:hypothetical protein